MYFGIKHFVRNWKLDIRNYLFAVPCVIMLFIMANNVFAYVMESNSYRIERDSINIGGVENSQSDSYSLSDTLGETGTGKLTATSYNLFAGYRHYDVVVVPTPEEEEEEAVIRDHSPPRDYQLPPHLDKTPPSNISNFTVVRVEDENSALLSWSTPLDPDYYGLRIVRSETFFPAHPDDGQTIYIGQDNAIKNIDLQPGTRYYYSAFSYDRAGNYSSGAIAAFIIEPEFVPGVLPEIPLAPPEKITPEVLKMSLNYFEFYQDDEILPIIGENKIYIDGNNILEIRLPYEKAPEVLKTILITLIEPREKKSFSFLLKINEEGTAYTAKIAPLKVSGLYEVSIAILDYENRLLKKIKSFFVVEVLAAGPIMTGDGTYRFWLPPDFLVYIFLVLIIAWFIFERKREKGKNTQQPISNIHSTSKIKSKND